MNKIIIGLVGEIASGKDAVAKYLKENHGFETVSFSKPLRDIADTLYIPQNRENLVWLGYDLRERFGKDILAKVMATEIKKSEKTMICLPNVRTEGDIEHLKDEPGFVLVHIDTDQKIRYQRLIQRSQNTDDQTKTWEQFLEDGKLPTEISIRGVAKLAKHTINNDGTLEDLHKQTEELLNKLKQD